MMFTHASPKHKHAKSQKKLVAHVFQTGPNTIQPKLKVGPANDKYEQEADQVAERVMRMPDAGSVSGSNTLPKAHAPLQASAPIQRKCQACAHDEDRIQRKPKAADGLLHTPNSQAHINSLHGDGQPLSRAARNFFEPRFGVDFSSVRIHSDAQADANAQSINARAFTLGQNVVFAAGQYAPDTHQGKKLLAHELTHVVQQSRGAVHSGMIQKKQFLHDPSKTIRRKTLFSSTMNICHRVLKSRTFKVGLGSVSVIANAKWNGPGKKRCGAPVYPMTLTEEGLVFDSERESCDFRAGRHDIQTWTNVPKGDYHLTIWPNNTNPHCCLNGTIKVIEQSGVTGPSCGGRVRKEKSLLDALHLALDAAGMFPALGVIPDAINGIIYLIEGDWTNAGISGAAMIPIFGQGVTVTKLGVKVTAKAVEKVGKEGIEQGLKQAKRVAKRKAKEKAAKEAAEKAAKEKASKETAKKIQKSKGKGKQGKKDKKGKKGKWGCQDVRCNVYPDLTKKPPKTDCPDRVIGATPYIHPSYNVACKAAQVAANLLVPEGCIKRHCNCKTKCTKK